MNLPYSLFALTIFLSSFLLFQVQPLIGKHILPWYGGSSAVWVTALFFFMVALAVGYIYALWLVKLRYRLQAIIHLVFTAAVVGLIFFHTKIWPSGITPSKEGLLLFDLDPTLSVFATLLLAIGLPFFLLSSTSSLLQFWYGSISGKDLSSLYGISNVGSLLGLLSYPFIFEPFLSTFTQGVWWTFGLAMYIGFLVSVIQLVIRFDSNGRESNQSSDSEAFTSDNTKGGFIKWLLVASVPVMALLSGTTFMTTTVAPVPLLWVGPLTLYLISFVWSFRDRRSLGVRQFHELAVLVSAMMALLLVTKGIASVLASVLVIHISLYAIFHWCHEYLFATRPSTKQLPLFYVALALGGILGSLVIKVSSLWILVRPLELTFILLGAISFIVYLWYPELPDIFPPKIREKKRHFLALIVLFVVAVASAHFSFARTKVYDEARNFFGHKAVFESEKDDVKFRGIRHGTTNHGFQVIEDGELIVVPASYYSETAGIGRTFKYLRDNNENSLKVVVVGLGTGGLTAYCRPGDEFLFIEIDPQVVAMAKENFTYLEYCPQYELLVGDGRLELEKINKEDPSREFDLIILDAYADDMMPIHLMTREAISFYKTLLSKNGILAINISSRYLGLLPVAKFLATENGLSVRHYFDTKDYSKYAVASQWVVMAKKEEVFSHKEMEELQTIPEEKLVRWTDTYSAILPVVRLW